MAARIWLRRITNKKGFIMKKIIIAIMLAGIVTFTAHAAEAPLTNADVLTISKLGLGDTVVIAKINQASAVSFSMDTDSLIKLKADGVSKEVIAAMLKRSTEPKIAMPPNMASLQYRKEFPAETALSTKSADATLQMSRAEIKSFGFGAFRINHFAFRGIKAKERTSEKLPTLTFKLDFSPVERAFFIKLDESPKEDYRSFRIVNRSNGAGPGDGFIVDSDATEVAPGSWKLTPKAELVPGEYGLYFGGMLWSFGVDPLPSEAASGAAPQSPVAIQ